MNLHSIQYAIRSLSRAPGYALAVILTLGLGIGANTAIFSVVRGVLLKPLPNRDGSRLVYLRQSVEGPGGEDIAFSVPEINDFRQGAPALGGIAEYSPLTYTLQGEDDALRINVGLVTGNYFSVMGLGTVVGRTLNANDDGTAVPPVIVLMHDFWVRRYRSDSSIVGKKLRIDGRDVEVVGVQEPAPSYPQRIDGLMNMVISEHHTSALMQDGRTHRMTQVVARMADGASLQQVRTQVATIRSRVQAEHPRDYDAASGYKVTVIPFQEIMGEKARLTLWLLMGAAAFVMIISCANVANLSLMRSVRREHELVVRAALGAGARRLRGLLLVENLVLAGAGMVLGLVLAIGGTRLLVSLAQRYSTRAEEIGMDVWVLGFTLLLTLLVAVLISYAPRLVKEGKLGSYIASGVTKMSGSAKKQRLQRSLVVVQIAVSVVLLTGAGLLTRTMMRLADVDTGLNTEKVLTLEVPLGFTRPQSEQRAMFDRMRNEMVAIPGVSEVGVGSTVPLRSAQVQLEVKAEGHEPAAGEAIPRAEFRTASTEYFRAAGIPLLSGREFLSTDREGSAMVVVINKTLADRLFPGKDPIGQRLAWTGDVLRFIPVSGDWRTVVGVVADTKDGGLDAPPVGVVFQPYAQMVSFGTGAFVIRASGDPEALASTATRVVHEVAPREPIENVLTIPQIRDQSVAPRRLNAQLVSLFGVLAVIIAAVGIGGVLAFSVSARTNEIGIRMSLGASSGMVQKMILAEGGVLLVVGLVLGVTASVFATRAIRGLLFGVAPYDPMTLLLVALSMTAVGVAACWLPAVRAARIDPAITMRNQ